jgi:peptide/nickel transport system substrate-binding protein
MAVDKDVLIDRLFGGYGTPGSTVVPPLYNEHLEPADPVVYDPDEANRMLDEAGYAKGDDGIRTMPDGSNPLVYRLFARSTSETSQQTIQLLQGWLKEIGIDSTVQVVSEDRLYEIAGEGTFELYEWGWVPEPDPDSMMSNFTCDQLSYEWRGSIWAGYNDSFYCDDEYEELYKQQAVELDPAKRTAIVQQMQQMLYDDEAYIVTAYYDYLQAYRTDRFTGFVPQPDPDGAILFQYGIFSYLSIGEPTGDTTSGEDSNTPMLILGAVGIASVVAVAAWLAARSRRPDSADTE